MTTHGSVWIPEAGMAYEPLAGDIDTDVAVIGAGITGLTAALLLQRAGLRVVVVDMHRIATGTTGHTTGKVTSQHGLTYSQLVREHGEGKARLYGEANEDGVAVIATLAGELDAPCELTSAPAFVYTTERQQLRAIEEEAEVARRLGLPAAAADPADVPFAGVLGAVRFDGQYHLDAYRYCAALAEAVVAGGGAVHEHTRARSVRERGDRVEVKTSGGTIRAEQALVATLLPIVDSGGYFAKARASRAYGLAARITDPERVGMFITAEEPTRSTRPWRHESGTGVIVVGEQHVTGSETDTGTHYRALEEWTRATFDVESIDFTWSSQDYTTIDRIPYAGRSPRRSRTWIATGFRKWGLSNGTAAAMTLADTMRGLEHPWSELFDAGRIGGRRAITRLVTENAKVGAHYVGDWIGRLHAKPVAELGRGEGAVVRDGKRTYGAYRDQGDTIRGVSLTCTHLGCTVRWNAAETTWDCPCHGSRFDTFGTVLQGPATKDLQQIRPDAGAPEQP